MIRNRLFLKTFSVFLALQIIANTLLPTVSFALTAGPTAPEVTSFEPMDMTDIVDLKTGDFTYNIPLIEIPGPAGSYPLALSYHGGIQPNEEASWTGLGFNVNPGSIFRMVNGYADDHRGVTNVDRSFWIGGDREEYKVGINYGISNVATVSAGLTFAHDTYKGSGVGGYIGASLSLGTFGKYGTVGGNAEFGISPYGDVYSSAGIGVGLTKGDKEAYNASANVGIAMNSSGSITANASGGVNYKSGSLLDASISTNGSPGRVGVFGAFSGVYNGRSSNVSYKTDNFQIDIPIYEGISLRLGRNYQRYWIDESATAETFGALYTSNMTSTSATALDTYDLADTDANLAEFSQTEKMLGGSFPEVDFYSVSGQGIGGYIRPFHFQQHLFRQDQYDGSIYRQRGYSLGTSPSVSKTEFRFVNDFSNRFEYDPQEIQINPGSLAFNFEGTRATGEGGNDGYSDGRLFGSKHIEWYSNKDIMLSNPSLNPYNQGFVNCVAEGFVREDNYQIGGFSITNPSGVTYHYALPAYSYDEFMKSSNSVYQEQENGERYNTLSKPEKYAYTWYLTAVTGPDFVDRNGNHIADHGDWGYWVNFEYKLWLDDYKWRNPGEGFNTDLDGEFRNYSSGRKEIYYLDKVVTETHIALFDKSPRFDGREVASLVSGGFAATPIFADSPEKIACLAQCEQQHCPQGDCDEQAHNACIAQCELDNPSEQTGYSMPRPTLRLDRIRLFNYSDFVIEQLDEEHLLRSIDFGYDYSLAHGVPNSYDNNNNPLGKLTLKTLAFKGKKGESVVPPISFDYKNKPYKKDATDVWGFYKDDFTNEHLEETNQILGRQTTEASALDVDAWSLKSITTPLGSTINIEYESDRYDDVVLSKKQMLRVHDVIDMGQNKLKVTFWEQVDLQNIFEVDETIDLNLVAGFDPGEAIDVDCSCDDFPTGAATSIDPRLFSKPVQIDEVDLDGNYIVIESAPLYSALHQTKLYSIDFINDHWGPCEDDAVVRCEYTYEGENAWPRFFLAGTASFSKKGNIPGGGLRVKSVSVTSPTSGTRTTQYQYASGVTTTEPFEVLAPKLHPDYIAAVNDGDPAGTRVQYKSIIYRDMYPEIAVARQLPGPSVIYKSVTVTEFQSQPNEAPQQLPNYTKYNFQTYERGMVRLVKSQVTTLHDAGVYQPGHPDGATSYSMSRRNKVAIKDYTSRVGNLKSVVLYDAVTNQPVSTTVNHYLEDQFPLDCETTGGCDLVQNSEDFEAELNNKFNDQGVIEQTFTRSRIITHKKYDLKIYRDNIEPEYYDEDNEGHLLVTLSRIETFPSILTGTESTNEKTGSTTKSETKEFDFYSGQPVKTLTIDSYGNRFLTVQTPAHKVYSGMGIKSVPQNKHMLTQHFQTVNYLVGSENIPIGLMSASVETWRNNSPLVGLGSISSSIWRPYQTYAWDGELELDQNGAYPIADFEENTFDWLNPSSNLKWLKTGEIGLYDIYSHGLEAVDVNGLYSATKMTNDQTKVTASGTNANYDEINYSGAEYYSGNLQADGGVDRGAGDPSKARAHTGVYSLVVEPMKTGFNVTLTSDKTDLSKKYRASVWVYAPGESELQSELDKIQLYYTVDGVEKEMQHPILQKSKSKSWYQINLNIEPGEGQVVMVGVRNGSARGVYFDDFRVHPIGGTMLSYVYDPFSGELTYILDPNNFYTKYEYDASGKLVRSSRERLNFDYGDGKESIRYDEVLTEVRVNFKGNN
jgi:YD repeat-containing protein